MYFATKLEQAAIQMLPDPAQLAGQLPAGLGHMIESAAALFIPESDVCSMYLNSFVQVSFELSYMFIRFDN